MYRSISTPLSTVLRANLTGLLTMLFAVGDFFYSWWVSLQLYRMSGGVKQLESGFTSFGGADHAWTIPLLIPGSLLLNAAPPYGNSFGWLGILLVFLAFVITAYALSTVIVDLLLRRRLSLGYLYWRGVVIVLGLVWIPVPEDYAYVYWYTVLY